MDELQILTVSTECLDDAIAYLSKKLRSDLRPSIIGAWSSEIGTLNRIVVLSQWEEGRSINSSASSTLESTLQKPTLRKKLLRVERVFLKRLDPFNSFAKSDKDIFELREYHFNPLGMERYETLLKPALPIRQNHPGFVGWWKSLTGCRDRVFLLWKYENLEHRMAVRKAATEDPEWKNALISVSPTIATMNSSILRRINY